MATARFLLSKDGDQSSAETPASNAVQQAVQRPGRVGSPEPAYRRQDNALTSSWDPAAGSESHTSDSPVPGQVRRRITVDVLQTPSGTAVASPGALGARRRSELDRPDLDSASSPSAGRKGVSFNLDATTYENPASGSISSSNTSETPLKQQAGVTAGGILSSWSAGHNALVARSNSAGKTRSNSPLCTRTAADSAASAGSEQKLPALGKQQGIPGSGSSSRTLHAVGAQPSAAAAAATQPAGKASQPVAPIGQKVISGSHSHIRPVNNHKTGYKTQSLGFKPRVAPVGLMNERAAMAPSELDSTRYDKILGKLDKEVVAADQRVYAMQQRRVSSSSEEQSEPSSEPSDEQM